MAAITQHPVLVLVSEQWQGLCYFFAIERDMEVIVQLLSSQDPELDAPVLSKY